MKLKLTDKVARITDCNHRFVGQGNVYRDLDTNSSYVHLNGRNIPIGYLTTRQNCTIEYVKSWDATPSHA